jgi:hypothetical protein
MPTYEHQNTGTAADLITYEHYTDSNSGKDELTRVVSALQEWVVKETGGETFYVKFDKNFSKKHLVTYSKKTNSQPSSVDSKIVNLVDHRSKTNICRCSHPIKQHKVGGTGLTCKKCGSALCTNFGTPYADTRTLKNKPNPDPLAGLPTTKNTCIVLNRVQKADFEDVVLQSILAHEKPSTWKTGDALAKSPGDEVELKWDFGARYPDAVVQADTTTAPANWPKKQGCKVKAVKLNSANGPTWQIRHFEGVI